MMDYSIEIGHWLIDGYLLLSLHGKTG